MFLNSNLRDKPSLLKPISIVVAILLVIGGAYSVFSKKSEDSTAENNDNANVKINSSGIDKNQRIRNVEDVEEVLEKWLANNPEAIIASVNNMQQKAMQEQAQNAQKNIGPKKEELTNDVNSPSYHQGEFDVTIVEFFDYNCGYCKRANSTVESLIKADSKIKIVYKEFPILGPSSEELSSIAIAVHLTDSASYRKFHNALMASNASSKEEALKIARDLGINSTKIEATLKNQKDKIAAIINSNRVLGGSIGIQGTPGFVVGDELIPGAASLESLQQKVTQQRKK